MTMALGSPAQACISCEYTPEVAKTPLKASPKGRVSKAAKNRASPAKKRIAKPQPASAPEKKVDTATKTVPVETQTEAEGSDVSTAALGQGDAKPTGETTESGSGTEVGCKKFSPTAGKTIPVPCE